MVVTVTTNLTLIECEAASTPSDFILDQDVIDGLLSLNEKNNEGVHYDSSFKMDSDQSVISDSSLVSSLVESLKAVFLNDNVEEPDNIDVASIASPSDFFVGKKLRKAVSKSSGGGFHKNVVVFHGQFNSYNCDLVVPYDLYRNLDVINDQLVNVGSSTVAGRILYNGESLDTSGYDSYVYFINPIYGSTSNVYRYGNFNYRRHYYLNNSSSYNNISYDDMYGAFYVDDVDVYMSTADRVYYVLLVILLFMGVKWLWIRRH